MEGQVSGVRCRVSGARGGRAGVRGQVSGVGGRKSSDESRAEEQVPGARKAVTICTSAPQKQRAIGEIGRGPSQPAAP